MNKQVGSLHRPSKWIQTVGLAWRALTHFGSLRRVMRFLEAPVFIDAFQDNPKMAYKYLTDSYLFHGLPVKDRADCFLHNHILIQERFPLPMLRQFLTWGVDLVEITKDEVRFTVRCGLSRPCGKEGEQTLVLLADGMLLYSIAFTIVPGYVTQSKAREVILVSRIQGEPALSAETLKRAQKALSKLRFGSLLMAGLEGIALEFGIEEIVCVSSLLQLSYAPVFADRFRHAYEDLFDERGFVKNEAGLYSSPVPMKERAPGTGKGNMGDRERNRHWFRQQVRAACRDFLHRTLLPVSLRPGMELTETSFALPDPGTSVHAEETELPQETSSLSFG